MNGLEIILTNHARFKLWVLEQHGFRFTEDQVKEAIKHPDFAKDAKFNRFSAHKNLNDLTLSVMSINMLPVLFYPV